MENSCFLNFYLFSFVYSVHYDRENISLNTKIYTIPYIMRTFICINNVNKISNYVVCNYCCIKLTSETNTNYLIIYNCKKTSNLKHHQMITFSFETLCCRAPTFNFSSDVNLLPLYFRCLKLANYFHNVTGSEILDMG
jgi:hypothetical protein